ncbi:hypothetical protein [Nocardioides mesophilus]|uniref:Uncharacterized protein n=1 Tax=Nocardioides mesophilus TaxID=433659 RepID=A0A7G9RGA2_9ACTN|nr:hypothetical protein [Nocardioides mesophilus]QNN54627.1 hypothetical protein H9L09_10170 [Nocardioides mesophilus]
MTALLPERVSARPVPAARAAGSTERSAGPSPDRLVLASQRRAAAHLCSLAALLEGRPDLRGTYAPADLAVEALTWCV